MTNRIHLKIPYGKDFINFSVESGCLLGILQNKIYGPVNFRKVMSEAFGKKTSQLLKRVVAGKNRILIVAPDATRLAHLKEILPAFIARIRDFNKRLKIDIVIATGLHKKHDLKQLRGLIGPAILKKFKVFSHEQKRSSLVEFGMTKRGVPITLNKALKNYDTVISIGVIEPHLYAGYSGGAKTAAIGLAGEKTINATHSVKFLDFPKTRIGSVKKNPFQETLWEIFRKTGVEFSVNTVNDSDGKALKIFAGETKDVFDRGIKFARGSFQVDATEPADIAICGVGYPKDVNLYQASRAFNYVLNVDRPVVRKGGAVIVAAELKDGIGEGTGEIRFYREMVKMISPREFVTKIRKTGCVAGVHRAYMVAKPLMDYEIIFVSRGRKAFLNKLRIPCFDDIESALAYARGRIGKRSSVYVIPRALATIARLKP